MKTFDHPVVVIHGRFQIFHRDHLRYVRAALERGAHVVIGLTGIPYLANATDANVPAHRLRPGENPLNRTTEREGVLLNTRRILRRESFEDARVKTDSRLPRFCALRIRLRNQAVEHFECQVAIGRENFYRQFSNKR